MPVPVAADFRLPRRWPGSYLGAVHFAQNDCVEHGNDVSRLRRLRTDAGVTYAHRNHAGDLVDQVVNSRRLGLQAVHDQEGFVILGGNRETVRVFEAAKAAVILREIVIACGETASRYRQWQATIGKHFRLHLQLTVTQHLSQSRLTEFDRHDPAECTQLAVELQRHAAIDVEVRAGNKRDFAGK